MTIWEDVLASPSPIPASKYPGMPGVNAEIPAQQDVIIPNAHAILYQMFASQGPVQLEVNNENQA